MGRLLKPLGSDGPHGRITTAEFDGILRDGATFSAEEVRGGDMILFKGPNGISSGINVSSDEEGLHSMIDVTGKILRIGIEHVGNGVYAFRPTSSRLRQSSWNGQTH